MGSFALELADELQLLVDTGMVRNAEMLGYMLRGFFEHQRRHIEWEKGVLLPLARQTLTPADLAELQAWILSSGRPARVEELGGQARALARRTGRQRPTRRTPCQLAASFSSPRTSGGEGMGLRITKDRARSPVFEYFRRPR